MTIFNLLLVCPQINLISPLCYIFFYSFYFKYSFQARDKGSPSLESNVTVQVVINDVNDNAPKFQQAFYNVTLPESTFTKTEVSALTFEFP